MDNKTIKDVRDARRVIGALIESPFYSDPPYGLSTIERLALVKRVLEIRHNSATQQEMERVFN
ncbi:MAG: hypothetical protein ACLFUU_12470 [Desulfobacteraceae bacterium]